MDGLLEASRELRAALQFAVGSTVHSEPRVKVAYQVLRLVRDSPAIAEIIRDTVVVLQADSGLLSVVTDNECHNLCQYNTLPPDVANCVPVEQSYCRYTITTGQPFIIRDAANNPIVFDSEYAATIRGYLGAPVYVAGHPTGSVCVISLEPRDWTARDIKRVTQAAGIVSDVLNKVIGTEQHHSGA